MNAYVKQLNAAVAIEQAQRAEKERVATRAARERLTPLEERLSRLLATTSLARYSAKGSHCPRCKPRCGAAGAATVTPGELGTALRKLDFKRERRWHDGSGFCALWYRA